MQIDSEIYAVISDITGHDPEDLAPDMYLDVDLGMDSIKSTELFSRLADSVPAAYHEQFNAKLAAGELAAIQTVGELIGLFEGVEQTPEQLEANATRAITADSAPPSADSNGVEEVDILNAQYPFLVSHWTTSCCSLATKVRLQGSVRQELLSQAWQALVDRHPMLRMRCHITPQGSSFSDYHLQVLSNVDVPQLESLSLQGLDEKQQQDFLTEEVGKGQNRVWDLQCWPLHLLSLYRLDETVYELLLTNHHLISDGLGNQQLIRELLELYGALERGREPGLPPATSLQTYRHLVDVINGYADADGEKAFAEYLKSQGRNNFFWNPMGCGRPSQPFAAIRHGAFTLDSESTEALLRVTTDKRVSVNTLLVAAYLATAAESAGEGGEMILNVPTSGRLYPGVDASDVVGCFAQNLALTLQVPMDGADCSSWLEAIDREIHQAIAAGYDRAQNAQSAAAILRMPLSEGQVVEPVASLIRGSIKSNLYMPYTGKTGLDAHYGSLQLADYRAYTSTNTGTLDTLIELFQGRLNITANYDGNYFSDAFIADFGRRFMQRIREIVQAVVTRPPGSEQDGAQNSAIDPAIREEVIQLAGEVMFRILSADEAGRDLEGELGLDSLERIRIVTRLIQAHPEADPQVLLECRSIDELAARVGVGDQVSQVPVETVTEVRDQQAPLQSAEWVDPPIPFVQIIQQAHLTPDATAVLTEEGGALSYRELNECSNRVAHYLRDQGIGVGDLVGVMMPHNAYLLEAVLGVLKAGAAYVPLDPIYPVQRLEYMLGHAQISVLLSEQSLWRLAEQLLSTDTAVKQLLLLDQEQVEQQLPAVEVHGSSLLQPYSIDDPECINSPDDLMVVLYTSGSTGVPKGVALAHRGYVNRFKEQQKLCDLKPGERVAQKTSICFDISVWELLWPLMLGGCVCTVDTATVKNPWKLAEWMERTQIQVMHFVPSLFGEFVAAVDFTKHRFADLRWLVFSGEALPVFYIQQWMDHYGDAVGLANLYGPTEASIDVTAHVIPCCPGPEQSRIPIGKCMDQVHLVVLDEDMKRLPPGEQGELWIGGIQLAQGYLRDPERTAKAFFPNPFPDEIPGKHLYRTGDLVIQLEDGEFDYHGRIDGQVKIRGFRVELGEVEASLTNLSGINEAAVCVMEPVPGQQQLWAWLAGEHCGDSVLRKGLQARLPAYMVPHGFTWMKMLPKNPNGKLDRKQLKWRPASSAPPQDAAPEGDQAQGGFYPLAPAQHWLVSFFEPPYRWAGFSRFRFLKPLHRPCFEQAIRAMQQRHPALRACFQRINGEWQQSFDAVDEPLPIDWIDGRSFDAQQRQQRLAQYINEVEGGLYLDRLPLWRMGLLQEPDGAHTITIVGHHMVNDLVGNGVLFKEMWTAYGQLGGGQEIALGPEPPTIKGYVEHLQSLGDHERKACVDYWRQRFPSREYALRLPVDFQRGGNTEGSATMANFTLSADKLAAIQALRNKHGCTLYQLLLAPLYRLIGEWSRQSLVTLSHRTHGRDLGAGQNYMAAVGNFAVNYPLGLSVEEMSWEGVIQGLRDEFAALPLNGVSFDWVGDELPGWLYPDNNFTPVRVNYLGKRDFPVSGDFEFDRESFDQRYSAPDQQRISLIEVFFSWVGDEMRVDWGYSNHFHSQQTIQARGDRYLELVADMLAGRESAPGQEQPIKAALPLSGKQAVVTGAGRGVGRAIALELAQMGAMLVLASRTQKELLETQRLIRQQGGEASVAVTDVRQLEQVATLVKSLDRPVDILVNNAGLSAIGPLQASDPQQWREVVETNLFGVYHCCREFVPVMVAAGGGKIINIGSDAAEIGYPLLSAYGASKHAVLGLTRSLAEEVKQQGIQVNAVCPSSLENEGEPGVTPKEIAATVGYLASSKADGITGQAINVFGRQDLYWYGSEAMIDYLESEPK